MAKTSYGISKFVMGAAGANGAMGASLADITAIVADSVTVTFPEPTVTDIIPEESDSPLVSLKSPGVKTLALKSHNVDPAFLPTVFGGATATATGVDTFTPGVSFDLPDQSIAFTTRPLNGKTQTWKFPRVSVVVSVDANPSKTNTMQLTFTFRVLQPVDAGGINLPDFIVTQQAA